LTAHGAATVIEPLGLQGKTACALGVSIAWATVPVTVAWLARLPP